MGNNQTRRQTLHDFETIRLLGKGAFGKVWLVKYKETGELFAMKILDKESVIQQNLIEHTLLERDVMLMCNNPFIINMYCSFQTITSLYFILEYVPGGSLWSYLCGHPDTCLSEQDTIFYASEIILGLEELHNKKVVYRDLKPENILICKDGHIVLTDFGLSHNLKSSNQKVHSFSGTAIYIAPEVLLEQGHNQVVDWWSLGIVLHLLLTGEPPFWSQNRKELFDMIKEGDILIDHPLLSDNAKDLIVKLLNRDTSTRLGAKGGAEELKQHPFFSGIDWEKVMQKELKPPYIPNSNEDLKPNADGTQDKEIKKTKHRRNVSVDAFQGFSFTRTDGEAQPEEQKKLKMFDVPKKFSRTKSSKKLAQSQSRSASVDITGDESLSAPKPARKRGHRRTKSQGVPAPDMDFTDLSSEPPSPAKKPKLGRLTSKINKIKK